MAAYALLTWRAWHKVRQGQAVALSAHGGSS